LNSDKQSNIISMFDDIASGYDSINSWISFGMEKIWRSKSTSLTLEYIKNSKVDTIVDVACGTGKMMVSWKKELSKSGIDYDNLYGVDPSTQMLKVAKNKLKESKFYENRADNLPFEDNTVDIISVAYGIRNIIDKEDVFKEFNRVLKKDGILLILEFVQNNKIGFIDKVKGIYIKNVIPVFGKLFSKNKDAFVYLGTSIDELPKQKIISLCNNHGFELMYLKSFNFGVSHTFISKKRSSLSDNDKKSIAKTTTKKEITIDKILSNVGYSLFITHFNDFKDIDIKSSLVMSKILKKTKYAESSLRTKISNARRIFKNGLESEALNLVIHSKKVESKHKTKAKKLLKSITN